LQLSDNVLIIYCCPLLSSSLPLPIVRLDVDDEITIATALYDSFVRGLRLDSKKLPISARLRQFSSLFYGEKEVKVGRENCSHELHTTLELEVGK
jgi:hypothetical protein